MTPNLTPDGLKRWADEYDRVRHFVGSRTRGQLYEFAAAWEAQVNTLTNERDLARRANEQNIKIIRQLRRQLRKEAKRRVSARFESHSPHDPAVDIHLDNDKNTRYNP